MGNEERAQQVLRTQTGDLGKEPNLVDYLLAHEAVRHHSRDVTLDVDTPVPVVNVVLIGPLVVAEKQCPGLVPDTDVPLDMKFFNVLPQGEDTTTLVVGDEVAVHLVGGTSNHAHHDALRLMPGQHTHCVCGRSGVDPATRDVLHTCEYMHMFIRSQERLDSDLPELVLRCGHLLDNCKRLVVWV